ncbi:MAG: AfsA-related hotdog domain-containing protein [Thermoanaerobaculia bacterium]
MTAIGPGVQEHLRRWTSEAGGAEPSRLDRTLVHKREEENVFVSRIERIAGEDDSFLAQLALSTDHRFFFEHPLDHYPGLMLVEAGRQSATALTHLFYGVPLGSVFILGGMMIDFDSFAELGEPVFALCKVSDKVIRHGQLAGMFSEGVFIQFGKPIGKMTGRWQIYERRVIERMRSVAQAERR